MIVKCECCKQTATMDIVAQSNWFAGFRFATIDDTEVFACPECAEKNLVEGPYGDLELKCPDMEVL